MTLGTWSPLGMIWKAFCTLPIIQNEYNVERFVSIDTYIVRNNLPFLFLYVLLKYVPEHIIYVPKVSFTM